MKDNKLHVLLIDSIPMIGGAESVLLDIIRHLADRYCFSLLTGQQGPLATAARDLGGSVSTAWFPWYPRRNPLPYWKLVAQISTHIVRMRVDIVHTHCDTGVPYAVRAARLTGRPCICHIHDLTRRWYAPTHVAMLNQASRVVAVSQAVSHQCREHGVINERLSVIHNGVDINRFEHPALQDGVRWRVEQRIPPNVPLVGIVGQVAPLKGHDSFLRAARQVLDAVPDCWFVVVGDDTRDRTEDYGRLYRILASELGIGARVIWAGFQREIPVVMCALNVVAVPSLTESFGLVVVEGLAAGVPIVATRAGGIPEIITDGLTGLLVAPQDVEGLARAIISLLCDPQLALALVARGRQHVRKHFSIERQMMALDKLYRQSAKAS